MKVTTTNAGPVHVAAVAGVGLGWRQTIREGSFRSNLPPFSTTPVEQTLSDAVFTTTFGFDVVLTVSPRTALVWTGRFHLLNDDEIVIQAAWCVEVCLPGSFGLEAGDGSGSDSYTGATRSRRRDL